MGSEYFKAMFSGPWKENADGLVHLDSTDSDVLAQGLRCLYARTTDVVEEPYKHDMHFNIRLYLFFGSYLADPLRKQAYQDCRTQFKLFQPRPERSGSLQELLDIVDLALTNTRRADTDLRPAVIQLCAHRFQTFGYRFESEPGFIDGPDLKLVAPGHLRYPKSETGDSSSTIDSAHSDKMAARELLSCIIERIKAEEPTAWKFCPCRCLHGKELWRSAGLFTARP